MHLFPSETLLAEHILAFLLILVSPLASYFYERPYLRAISSSRQKVAFYRYIVLAQWPVAAAALWILGPSNVLFPPTSEDPAVPSFARIVFGVLLAAFFILGLMPFFQSLRGEKYRAAYARAYHRSLDDVSKLLPETYPERLWFAGISVTAGVCEEVLCRGFMIRYLEGIALHLPLVWAILLAAAIFGVNHIYQGKLGMLKTGIAGIAFGGLFLFTGSLLLPILLHTAIDMQTVFVLRPAKPQPDEPIEVAS
jgi:membrane protease YdiL (CAAX protease family)